MRKLSLLILMVLGVVALATAQVTSPTQDVLGAHNVYGRGCIACHAPHSGAAANGGKISTNSQDFALWGEDMSPLYGQTLAFGDAGSYTVTLPNYSSGPPGGHSDPYFSIISCLSCHDGNLAKVSMMKGTSFETVTINGSSFNPPTLLGNDGSGPGNYQNDHPVGPLAIVSCGGSYNWDCTVNADGSISFNGPASSQFIADYFDVTKYGAIKNIVKEPPSGGASQSWVNCTTCHDQHDMQYFSIGNNVYKPTHFFVRGWYDPGNNTTSNSAAQFCRSCHGGESNEMHGQNVPTT